MAEYLVLRQLFIARARRQRSRTGEAQRDVPLVIDRDGDGIHSGWDGVSVFVGYARIQRGALE